MGSKGCVFQGSTGSRVQNRKLPDGLGKVAALMTNAESGQ